MIEISVKIKEGFHKNRVMIGLSKIGQFDLNFLKK
jgi:hypothetical protein